MNKNPFEEFDSEEPIEHVKMDLELIRKNLPDYSNEKLCDMIVCDRYFGFEQKISSICMEELAKRRQAGDAFDFETYIANAHKELPVLDFSVPDIRSILSQVIGKKVK